MFYFDPLYMIIGFIGMILVFLPQMFVKNTYAKYSKVESKNNITGAEIAKSILSEAGITNVPVEATPGELTDHYDPTRKILRLSHDNYYGTSLAALGVSAHEAGHAIQDFRGYLPMKLRAGIFPAVQAGQMLGPLLLMAGISLRFFTGMGGGFSNLIAVAGLILYGSVVLFHMITLPVEFDASFRAVRALSSGGYVVDDEIVGAKKVLYAAALTYVAVALYALMELVYWAWRLFGNNRD